MRQAVTRLRHPRGPVARLWAAVAVLAVLTVGVAIAVRLPRVSAWAGGPRSFGLFATLFVLYGVGAWLVSALPPRLAAVLVLGGAVATQTAALTARPRYSTDLFRYVWDGVVQSHGVDPYRYVPMASRLAAWRTPELFPAVGGPAQCVPAGPGISGGCTLLNRPLVHTIYPPVAEGYFWLTHWAGPKGVQLFAALCAVLVTALLIRGLPRLGADPRLAVLWAWCPTVAVEAGNGGHVDVLAVLLACLRAARAGRSAHSFSAPRVRGGCHPGPGCRGEADPGTGRPRCGTAQTPAAARVPDRRRRRGVRPARAGGGVRRDRLPGRLSVAGGL